MREGARSLMSFPDQSSVFTRIFSLSPCLYLKHSPSASWEISGPLIAQSHSEDVAVENKPHFKLFTSFQFSSVKKKPRPAAVILHCTPSGGRGLSPWCSVIGGPVGVS